MTQEVRRYPVRLGVVGLGMGVPPHARSLAELQAEGLVEVVGG